MIKCSCGHTFSTRPANAKYAPDAVLPGYYFNCPCKSTHVWPLDDKDLVKTSLKKSIEMTDLILIALNNELNFMRRVYDNKNDIETARKISAHVDQIALLEKFLKGIKQ